MKRSSAQLAVDTGACHKILLLRSMVSEKEFNFKVWASDMGTTRIRKLLKPTMSLAPDAETIKIIKEGIHSASSEPVIHDIGSWSVKVIYQAHYLRTELFEADAARMASYVYSSTFGGSAVISADAEKARITFGFKFALENWEEALKLAKVVSKEALSTSSYRQSYDFHDYLVAPATEV